MANILLVDDSKDFIEPVAFWLSTKGYTVRTAANGREALDQIKKELPDAVFLDINMPEMNGLEALRQLRAMAPDLPVVMLTAAYQNEQYFTEASKLRIAGFFPKSHGLPELSRMIETILRGHTKKQPPAQGTQEKKE